MKANTRGPISGGRPSARISSPSAWTPALAALRSGYLRGMDMGVGGSNVNEGPRGDGRAGVKNDGRIDITRITHHMHVHVRGRAVQEGRIEAAGQQVLAQGLEGVHHAGQPREAAKGHQARLFWVWFGLHGCDGQQQQQEEEKEEEEEGEEEEENTISPHPYRCPPRSPPSAMHS